LEEEYYLIGRSILLKITEQGSPMLNWNGIRLHAVMLLRCPRLTDKLCETDYVMWIVWSRINYLDCLQCETAWSNYYSRSKSNWKGLPFSSLLLFKPYFLILHLVSQLIYNWKQAPCHL
jgi:hypothetical protein